MFAVLALLNLPKHECIQYNLSIFAFKNAWILFDEEIEIKSDYSRIWTSNKNLSQNVCIFVFCVLNNDLNILAVNGLLSFQQENQGLQPLPSWHHRQRECLQKGRTKMKLIVILFQCIIIKTTPWKGISQISPLLIPLLIMSHWAVLSSSIIRVWFILLKRFR